MAENKIDVGGRLHSIATGNVLAGANEILDDSKNKKQSDINAETDAALEDRYTKEQTYSKPELNNLITTPNQQYVSVTANSQTTTVTDVLPATGAANTVYRVGNWDGSQFDASAYSEYAWNGSQYVHLSKKSQIGEVFDISAYHATGGTLATYADLSAALDSNNGGGVPQSLQKGGMSVKFVQSSDNKYMQFRCMAQNFTTDITQWQGVDDEPIDNSKNLIESGAVAQISNALELKVNYAKVELGNIDSNGVDADSDSRTRFVDYFSITADPTISVKVDGTAKSIAKRFYSSNNPSSYIGTSYTSSANYVRIIITNSIQISGVELIINSTTYYSDKYKKTVSKEGLESYAQKSILSNTGQFNQLFKEFYISGHSFDVTTVTSMYIDKAKQRSNKYRNGITLKVGNTEVISVVKDYDTQEEANNAIKSNEVNKLTGSNGKISFIIDWDALNSNTRTEFNVSLTKNVESIDLNPSIKLNERYQIDSAITPDSDKLAVSGDVAKYAKRALLSNNGQFNKLFSEFYLTGNSFDVSSITSLYIDKAKYRSVIERYRTGITLLAGETEVFSHHADFETAEAAVNYFANKNIVKLIDGTNTDTILYVVIDWDSLDSNTRTTINVSLNATAVTRYDCNPFIGSVLLSEPEPQPTGISELLKISVGNNNVHDFDSEYPSRDVNADLASWKDLLTTFLNRDFLTIVEWSDNFDNAGNVNTYNTLLKQFYPYYHTTAVKGLFSKLPCEFEEIVIRFTQIVAKTNIGGKSLAVVCWHHTNTVTPAIRRASYRELISYLADFDLAIISGDFNNDDGAEELSEFTDAGYVLGNNGYWGQIDTCTTSTSPTFAAIDNIITKGFIYDSFEKSDVKVQTDHYPVRAKLTLTV